MKLNLNKIYPFILWLLLLVNLVAVYLLLLQYIKNNSYPKADISWIQEGTLNRVFSKEVQLYEQKVIIPLDEKGRERIQDFLRTDINRAGFDELVGLNGIGAHLAEVILKYRVTKGGFKKVEDLLEIKGIGPYKFKALKDQIVIGEWDE